MEIVTMALVLVIIYVSFSVSASAGLGGSLLLVPTLALLLGTKEGVALAALLLSCNNVMKILAYRHTLPFRSAAVIAALVGLGTWLGSTLLVNAPTWAVTIGVVAMFCTTMVAERREYTQLRTGFAPLLALVSGASSGFSGTSGPLKGVAIRNLDLDRRHFVGAASLVGFTQDAVKTIVFTDAELLTRSSFLLALAAVPLMVLGTWTGSTLNSRAGENMFAVLFWSVMGGYTIRLGVLLF